MPDLNTSTEAATVAALVQKANTPILNVTPSGLAVFPNGSVVRLAKETDNDHPRRKRANVNFVETQSFIDYINDHKQSGQTHVFGEGNDIGGSFHAIIDFHAKGDGGIANWGEHNVELLLSTTPEWRRWTANNMKQLSQEAFAEFLEDNLNDVIEPDAASLIDIALMLTGKKSVTFKSGKNLKNGAITLEYIETIESTGGRTNGDMQIPDRFKLGLCPFLGSNGVEITARLRFRISDGGKISFSYVLDRPDRVIQEAFEFARAEIAEKTGITVLLGSGTVINSTL